MMRKDWMETEATIESIREDPGVEGSTFHVIFTYRVGDGYFGGTFTASNGGRHYEGEKIPVWYDPADPGHNNLAQKEKVMNWIYVFIGAALCLYWIYSMVRTGIK
jgi:hypothetical protein